MNATELALRVRDLNLQPHQEPYEKTLGIGWNVHADTFQFKINLRPKPDTRRGILSQVSSVFNPLALVAPVLLGGKQILQALCLRELDWDAEIPEDLRLPWETWKSQLETLEKLEIQRCVNPPDLARW